MGLCISNHRNIDPKTILLLGLGNSGVIEFYNKIKNNNSVYKILLSNNYSTIYDIIIYFIDITTKINYTDNILLSNLSQIKNKPVYIFLNIKNINFSLDIKETEIIINYISNTYNLFNKNITFIHYLDTITKIDILNAINVL